MIMSIISTKYCASPRILQDMQHSSLITIKYSHWELNLKHGDSSTVEFLTALGVMVCVLMDLCTTLRARTQELCV
uniref:Uncharacterized protein n=1 Tax=Brassica oleracea TaxID=3712 RepID=A0A3P6GDE4_BRAOL|nr:unnamed protein product [Brassica oleracea]